MDILLGKKEYFKGIDKIQYEGPTSKNPMAFRFYDADRVVAGKKLKDHFKFAAAYWHSMCNGGEDPFGVETRPRPWLAGNSALEVAQNKMDAAFEFMTKLGLEYFCFHSHDLIDEADNLKESEVRLQQITDYAKEKMDASGVKLLWGTANLFSHTRYMNGAATNPNFDVLAYAAAQIKHALDATIKLNGENYVFWGGREGYMSLLNTDMAREQEHLAKVLHAAKDYARAQGFKGTFFIEPKPCEPTKHQYDYDSATVLHFLHKFGLEKDFKINIEVNHAILSGHTFQHELEVAGAAGMLGSIDANRGDYLNGWDTDQFPNNIYELTEAMLVFLRHGGLQGGGVNFDAKLRRNSTDLEDLFHAHIGGMDIFARALITADAIMNGSDFLKIREERYASFDSGKGKEFEEGKLDLSALAAYAVETTEPAQISGKQELMENILNLYI